MSIALLAAMILVADRATKELALRTLGVGRHWHGVVRVVFTQVQLLEFGAALILLTGSATLLAVGTPRGTIFGFALAAGGVGNRFFDKYDEYQHPGRVTMGRVIGRAVADYATSRLSRRPRSVGHLFSPTHARVVIDGRVVPTYTHNALHAGAFDVNLGGVLRVFPLAREPGALHFQAGAIPPAQMMANLPVLVAGRAIRSARMLDVSGREMVIEAAAQPLSPIIDGERFTDITRLVVRAGPKVRIAVPGSVSRQRI